MRGRHRLPGPAIVILAGITLAEVICLYFVDRTTQCFLYNHQQIRSQGDAMQVRAHPVNLIVVVGQHVNGADNASTGRGLHLDGYLAIEDVVVCYDCRGVTLLVDRELCTIRPSDYRSTKYCPFIQSRSLGQVVVDMSFGGTLVRRAGFVEGITVWGFLSKNEGNCGS